MKIIQKVIVDSFLAKDLEVILTSLLTDGVISILKTPRPIGTSVGRKLKDRESLLLSTYFFALVTQRFVITSSLKRISF